MFKSTRGADKDPEGDRKMGGLVCFAVDAELIECIFVYIAKNLGSHAFWLGHQKWNVSRVLR